MSCGMVSSRLASSQTMAADLPPSSRVQRLSCSPQMAPILRPAAVEPVKLTLSMSGWRTRCSPTSRSAGTMFTTPAGTPASMRTSARMLASRGVSGAGLSTMVEPEAIVGPSLSAVMNSGTFQGMMPAQTPTGSRRTRIGAAEGALTPLLERELPGVLGEGVEHHAAGQHLAEHREVVRRTDLAHDEVGELVLALLDAVGDAYEELGALLGGPRGPLALEGGLGGGHGPVHVGGGGHRHRADDLFGGRREHLQGLVAGGVDPLATDEELVVRLHCFPPVGAAARCRCRLASCRSGDDVGRAPSGWRRTHVTVTPLRRGFPSSGEVAGVQLAASASFLAQR